MTDPRTIDDVTVEGVDFTVAFVIGAKGKANIYLPDNKHHYFETPEEGAL